MSRAKDSFIWDLEGLRYIDLSAGFGALPLGHNHDGIVDRLGELFSQDPPPIIHGLGDLYPSQQKIELLETVCHLFPKEMNSIALTVTGSQAVELAMKTALMANRGDGFIGFKNAYHGLEFGSLALSDREFFRAPFRSWLNGDRVYQLPFGCDMSLMQKALDQASQKGVSIGAVLLEPIQGRAGVILPPDGWLQEVSEFCRAKGILLIFDEILTGLGRLGQWTFASEVAADLVCLGKAIGGGMPLSACIGRRDVMGYWPESRGEAMHTGTYFGHPLSCLVGRLTLEQIEAQALLDRARSLGQKTMEDMSHRWVNKKPLVKEIRGSGLMMVIEFPQGGMGVKIADLLRQRGVIAVPAGEKGQCLSLTPALNIKEDLLAESLDLMEEAFSYL
jgi:4-aminobutyrate aminotransferase/(S)-3-amino-2-methylpropionate transaminase